MFIESVEHVRDFTLRLRFADRVEGEIDLSAELDGEIFKPLRDPAYFRQFRLDTELHTIVWPNGADFAPEFLYSRISREIKSSGDCFSIGRKGVIFT